jgi:hypothetical protein
MYGVNETGNIESNKTYHTKLRIVVRLSTVRFRMHPEYVSVIGELYKKADLVVYRLVEEFDVTKFLLGY